jgi:hypothetical protein
MRLASLITCSVVALLLLTACASSTTQTPEEGSASGLEIPDVEPSAGERPVSMKTVTRPVPDERKDGADG